MSNFTKDLNPEQARVVETGDGPCLVLAGAGSGKTRTITHRVAYLLEQGVDPNAILLVTFTNKAADEMRRRVAALTGTGRALPWSGTFHHIGYRLLRIHAPLVGFKNNFTVLDTDDSESILKMVLKEIKPDNAAVKFPSAGVLHNIISFSRNAERPLAEVIEERYLNWIRVTEEIVAAAKLYEQKKREANALDFDDLLTKMKELLGGSVGQTAAPMGSFFFGPFGSGEKSEPMGASLNSAVSSLSAVGQKYANQFRYVLVDEYQDTNTVQASIIKLLASVHKNVLVVGDDAQSIYSFRAANVENILGFETVYPGAHVFKLETNYRSEGPILALANNVIANNVHQYFKKLHPVKKGENLPILSPQLDQQSEANWVAREIEKLLSGGTAPNEIAVLFRAASHSQMLEVELVSRGINYDYRGGVRFFDRAHIKDALAYLRILSNLADTAAWVRVLLHEEGVGPAAAEKVISRIKGIESVDQVAAVGREVLGAKAQIGWEHFLQIWNALLNCPARTPEALLSALVASPYAEYLEQEFVDSRDRIADLKQLALFAHRYDDLDTFLAESTLQESFRTITDEPQNEAAKKHAAAGKIVLSTIHQAKGLEWSAVFIINLAAGAFPSERALREDNGLEEERRLLYVAITRAKEKLFLSYPMSGGGFGDFVSGPSLFLGEINPELIDDRSLLSYQTTAFHDSAGEVSYVSEDEPFASGPKKIRPGSFLQDISDL